MTRAFQLRSFPLSFSEPCHMWWTMLIQVTSPAIFLLMEGGQDGWFLWCPQPLYKHLSTGLITFALLCFKYLTVFCFLYIGLFTYVKYTFEVLKGIRGPIHYFFFFSVRKNIFKRQNTSTNVTLSKKTLSYKCWHKLEVCF